MEDRSSRTSRVLLAKPTLGCFQRLDFLPEGR